MNPKKKGIIQTINTQTTAFKSFFLASLNTHIAKITNRIKGITIKQISKIPNKLIGLKIRRFPTIFAHSPFLGLASFPITVSSANAISPSISFITRTGLVSSKGVSHTQQEFSKLLNALEHFIQ